MLANPTLSPPHSFLTFHLFFILYQRTTHVVRLQYENIFLLYVLLGKLCYENDGDNCIAQSISHRLKFILADDFKFRPQVEEAQESRKVEAAKTKRSRVRQKSCFTDPADNVQVCSCETHFLNHFGYSQRREDTIT